MPRPQSLADFLHTWTFDKRPFFPKLLNFKGSALTHFDNEGKRQFREDLLKADRFVLSNAFIERAVTRSNDARASHMLALADLARLPSRPVLVEYDDEVRYETQVRLGSARKLLGPEVIEDWARAGFLYVPGIVPTSGWDAVHVSSSPTSMPVWPVTSRLLGADDKRTVNGLEHESFARQFFASAWGITVPGDEAEKSRLRFATIEELENRGYAGLDPYFGMPFLELGRKIKEAGAGELASRMAALMRGLAQENAGSLRLSTAILASLNTVPTRVVRAVAQGTFQYRFRNLPKFDTKTVHIDARPGHEVHVYDRSMHEATARHNRRHEVRGHWRDVSRSGAPIVCAHEPADVDGDYALCGKCTRLLRWIEHHERGDENLGWVFHDHYEVQ